MIYNFRLSDLLPSPGILLQRGSVPISSTRAYPSAFSLAGSGSDVEGFSSGLHDPRPALRTIMNTMLLYKYSPTCLPCCILSLKR